MKQWIWLTLLFSNYLAASIPLKQEFTFQAACESGEEYQLSFVGDLLLHSPLQKAAIAEKDFSVLWEEFIPLFQRMHFSYANLEGPVAEGTLNTGKNTIDPGLVFDNRVYTSYPMFNYHSQLIDDLIKSGINIVSTANNHSLDRHSLGIDKTIETLDNSELAFTGTRSTKRNNPFHTITEVDGLKIAWIACTEATNGIIDRKKQVLNCNDDKLYITSLIHQLKLKTDGVILLPHWGEEYRLQPTDNQKKLAKHFAQEGAMAIIGNHPHVLQPAEKILTKDKREVFVIYSLGNFVSSQKTLEQKTTAVLILSLKKLRERVKISGIKLVPAFMGSFNKNPSLRPLDLRQAHPGLKHIRSIFNEKHLANIDESFEVACHE